MSIVQIVCMYRHNCDIKIINILVIKNSCGANEEVFAEAWTKLLVVAKAYQGLHLIKS